jgi:hypothetical protein
MRISSNSSAFGKMVRTMLVAGAQAAARSNTRVYTTLLCVSFLVLKRNNSVKNK